MKALPDGFDPDLLAPTLAAAWGLEARTVDYLAVGFGSYHWRVTDTVPDTVADQFFVTVDDLDRKPWLGDDRDTAFDGLGHALDTAHALHMRSKLPFVLAPIPNAQAQSVTRLDDRYAMAVYPFIDGVAGHFGQELTTEENGDIINMLACLHQADPIGTGTRVHQPFPGRAIVETALDETDRPWHSGPFGEPARAWVTQHTKQIRQQLREFDRLTQAVTSGSSRTGELVITHGEPHPGNVMHSGDQPFLIDWDTVALAPAERDLWMLAGSDPGILKQYVAATGHQLDEASLALYRLAWDLTDIASYVADFRSSHARNEDTEQAWGYLTGTTFPNPG